MQAYHLSDIEIFHETFEGNAIFLPLDDTSLATSFLATNDMVSVSDRFELPFDVIEKKLNTF